MALHPIYTLWGGDGSFPVKGYGIAASEAFDQGDVVLLNASGVVAEPASAADDVFGVSLEDVTGGASGGPQSTICLVVPFIPGIVFATTEVDGAGDAPVVTDIGDVRDLAVNSGEWGIHSSTSGTASTPQLVIIDVDTVRGEYHVTPAIDAALYQAMGAGP